MTVSDELIKLYKKVNRIDFKAVQVFQYDENDPDYALVGIKDAEGHILEQETVRVSTDSRASMSPGAIVHIGYDREGAKAVIGDSFTGAKAQGGSPGQPDKDTPPDVRTEQFIPLSCHPTFPASLYVVVRQFIWVNENGVRRELPTALINLTSAVGALSAGTHCMAVLFLVDNGIDDPTVSIVYSTPKSTDDPLTDDDENECLAQKPANTKSGIYAWEIIASITAITDEHRGRDLRQLVNLEGIDGTTVSEGEGIDVVQAGNDFEVGIADGGVTPAKLDLSSLTDGVLRHESGVVTFLKHNFAGIAAPLATNDETEGYSIGSLWYYNSILYECWDATEDNAFWYAHANADTPIAGFIKQAPGTDAENTIQPDADNVSGLILKPSSGSQTAALLKVLDESDAETLTIDKDGVVVGATLTTPTIADLTNAQHDHEDASGGGQLGLGALATEAGDAGETLIRNNSGLVVSNPMQWGVRNLIIDGDFKFWDFTVPTPANGNRTYISTMHAVVRVDDSGTFGGSASKQTFTVGQTDVPYEPEFYMRMSGAISGGGNSHLWGYTYAIEDVRTGAGQNVTVSIWLKGSTSGTVAINLFQLFGSGGSSIVYNTGQDIALTTSWQLFKFTFAMPSISGKTIGVGSYVGIRIYKQAGSTAASTANLSGAINFTGDLDIANIQAEIGSIATPFEKRSTALDRMLAERYYQKSYDVETVPGSVTEVGAARYQTRRAVAASTAGFLNYDIQFRCLMRAAPTITLYSTSGGSGAVRNAGISDRTGVTASDISNRGASYLSVSDVSANAIALDDTIVFHWVADTRL